jgi:hypothetical protein
MWFKLAPADLGFLAVAPSRFDTVMVIEATPERIFRAFVEPAQMAKFIYGFRRCAWQTPAPYGVGALRQLDLWGLSFREHFIAWQDERRLCFSIDATSFPLMTRMVEDIQIDPLEDDRSRLVWSVYYEPKLLTRLVHPFARFGFELGYRKSVERLARFLMTTAPREPRPTSTPPTKGRRRMIVS